MNLLFFFLVSLKALSYWIVSWLHRSAEPLSTIVMYRVGDIDFFPAISALSRMQWGESMLFELNGTGITSVPVVPLLLHSLLFRIFSAWGFIAADVVIAVVFYLALKRFLRLTGISLFSARAFSLLYVSGALTSHSFQSFFVPLWDWRIPRAFVSEILFFVCLCLLFVLMYSPQRVKSIRFWFLFGAAFSLLLQNNIYTAVITAMGIFAAVLYLPLRHKDLRSFVVRGALVFSLTWAACSIPFFLQRIFEHPDFPIRMGLFPVSRMAPLFLPLRLRMPVILLFTLILLRLFKYFYEEEERQRRSAGTLFMCFLVFLAYIALPVSCIVLGWTIQPYHFNGYFKTISYFTLLFFCFCALDVAGAVFRRQVARFKAGGVLNAAVKTSFMVVVIAWSVIYMVKDAVFHEQLNRYARWYFEQLTQVKDYRDEFISLTQELSKEEYRDCAVIGTFDWQVCSWWLTFRQGYSFLGYPFLCTAGDREIEGRLAAFCKLIGMAPEDFARAISRFYINFYWLSHAKYQAYRTYTFSPLWDYDERALRDIKKSQLLEGWNLAVPESEKARLVNQYARAGLNIDAPRLDLIVLNKDAGFGGFAPPQELFYLTYENRAVRVWKRR